MTKSNNGTTPKRKPRKGTVIKKGAQAGRARKATTAIVHEKTNKSTRAAKKTTKKAPPVSTVETEKKATMGVIIDNRGKSVDLSTATELEDFNFEGWDFTGLDLSHIKSFSRCNFREAKFNSSEISGQWDSCDLEGVSFRYGKIEDATFTNTKFRFTNFDSTNMTDTIIGKGSSLYFSTWKFMPIENLTVGPGLEELSDWNVFRSDLHDLKINGGVDEYDEKTQGDHSADFEYNSIKNFEVSNMEMSRFKFRDNELEIGNFKNVKFGEYTFFDNKTNRISLTNVSTRISMSNISGVELSAFSKSF